MRMDQDAPLTAYDVVNSWSYEQLVRIFFQYGEEKFSKQIARKIEAYRENKAIETTGELVELIKEGIPLLLVERVGILLSECFRQFV